jgi:hypothetical protein
MYGGVRPEHAPSAATSGALCLRGGKATIRSVGQTIACGARIDGKAEQGTALLETEEVIFRGSSARVRVPFGSIRSLAVKEGWLLIRHGEASERRARSLDLELGKRAAIWEEKIRSPKGLVAKLGVKSGANVVLVGFRDEALAADLAKLGATVEAEAERAAGRGREHDVIFFRVAEASELGRVKGLARKLTPDGALWIVRPKGKDGVAESAVFEAGRGAGLVDVKIAKWSDADTGMKFVIPKAARKSTPRTKASKRPARAEGA